MRAAETDGVTVMRRCLRTTALAPRLPEDGGALVVTFALAARRSRCRKRRTAADKSVAADEVDGFIAIDAKGKVTIYPERSSSAPALLTAIAQIAAEELSVPLDRVTMIQGDTALTPNQGPTYASLSIQNGGMQIRRAAATAREALLERAATSSRSRRTTLEVARRRGHAADRRRRAVVCATDRRAKACDRRSIPRRR